MFGFGKKKAPPQPQNRREELKIPEINFNFGDDSNDLDDDDNELEDELRLILESGEGFRSSGNTQPQRPPPPKPLGGRSKPLKDEVEDDEGGDSDPELLSELDKIIGLDLGAPSPNKRPSPSPNPELDGDSALILAKLQERKLRYEEEVKKAGENQRKARQMGRIVDQYKETIRSFKSGAIINFEELPTPPGFEPIISSNTGNKPEDPPLSSEDVEMADLPELPNVPQNHLEEPLQPPRLPSPIIPTKVEIPPPDYENIPKSEEPPVPPPRPAKKSSPELPQPEFKDPLPPHQVQPNPKPQNEQLNLILARQNEFKKAALTAKKDGDLEKAKQLIKYSMGFKKFIQDATSGLQVQLEELPTLSEALAGLEPRPHSQLIDFSDEPKQISIKPQPIIPPQEPVTITPAAAAPPVPPPDSGDQILNKLEERRMRYQEEVAKAGDNQRKVRQMGRIVKQFDEAISLHKRGKPVAYEELPTPPGFEPINTVQAPPPPLPVIAPSNPPAAASPATGSNPSGPSVSPGRGGSITRPGKSQSKLTLQEKQLALILERQGQFKQAAINAKKRGDVEQAKQLLKSALGFNKLIEHSKSGLPVDLATLPSPPEAVAALEAETFEVISAEDCIGLSGDSGDVFAKLEEDLKSQMKMCMRTREHFRNMGDVASANRFELMALESKKDLDALRLVMRSGKEVPKFHYETRIFSITECNTDLGADEIEISVLRGVNFKVSNPDQVDTFVKVDLPYPSNEEAQSNKSNVVKDTNNPEYNSTYKMNINRSARNFQRFIHRHSVKFEVWSKGRFSIRNLFSVCSKSGFLRGSTLIGTGNAKLLTLETKCAIHEAIDILDGRKVVGKLEIKIRLRDPVVSKEVKQKKEKWLSIDRI